MSSQGWSRMVRNKGFKGSVDANAIPIGCVVAHYGGQVREGKNVKVSCVMHDDKHGSAVIDTVNNLYFCHTCGKGGNAANLVCFMENMEFIDGLKRATEIAAGSGATLRTGNKSRGSSRTRRTWDI